MANTHMGQSPKNHVNLVSVGGRNTGDPKEDIFFRRVHSDGRQDEPFRVPTGKVFVGTDVDWQFNSGEPGSRLTFVIFIRGSNFENEIFESTVILNDKGDGGISESMTSGFVVSSEATFVVSVRGGSGGGSNRIINQVIIRGYLCSE
jgi:hypothetical protein